MTQVTLNYEGTDYKVLCTSVGVGYSPKVEAKPNANWIYPVQAQTLSLENPIYTLKQVMITEEAGTLPSSTIKEILTDQSAEVTIKIDYGVTVNKYWTSLSGATEIPVVMKPFSVRIPISDTYDDGTSKYLLPNTDLVFQETT